MRAEHSLSQSYVGVVRSAESKTSLPQLGIDESVGEVCGIPQHCVGVQVVVAAAVAEPDEEGQISGDLEQRYVVCSWR